MCGCWFMGGDGFGVCCWVAGGDGDGDGLWVASCWAALGLVGIGVVGSFVG